MDTGVVTFTFFSLVLGDSIVASSMTLQMGALCVIFWLGKLLVLPGLGTLVFLGVLFDFDDGLCTVP